MNGQDTIGAVLRRFRDQSKFDLIRILQEIQEAEGCLSENAILRTAEFLSLPPSQVYGVATFYRQFSLRPSGKFRIQVCSGTSCHVKGSVPILQELERLLKIKPGQTTADGMFSLELTACLGACGKAPVIRINDEIRAGFAPETLSQMLDSYRDQLEKGDLK